MEGIIQVDPTSSEDLGFLSLDDKKEKDRKSHKLGSSYIMLGWEIYLTHQQKDWQYINCSLVYVLSGKTGKAESM